MRAKQFLASALAQVIADRVQLGARPTVIDAPPSQVADYPTIAVWIERSAEDYAQPSPVLEDADGAIITGTNATTEDGEFKDGTPVMIGDGVWVSSVGTLHCFGRIWVGCRYPAKREEVEEQIFFAFNAEDSSPGRLMLPLAGYQLGAHTIHFGFAAADLGESSWSGEHSFEARLWGWRPFTLDVELLVPRNDPMAAQLILEFTQNLAATVDDPTDVPLLPDLEKYIHNADGDLVTTTL